jgi:perosamine synthetase
MSADDFIPVNDTKISRLEIQYAVKALKSGFISGTTGEYIGEFERLFAAFCETKFGVACTNGTTALQLAVRAMGIKAGDEVIVNTFTNIASVLCIIYNGAKPVLVDSRRDTWSMDESKVEEKITDKTKAIIPVHIYGHPVKMDTIMELAGKYKLKVIEDAAEAHGATFNGRKVGGIGDAGCFSFLAGKIIMTGEGGMVVTNDEALANKMKSLRGLAFGSGVDRYHHVDLGFNFRLTNLQAAIGVAQMQRANELVETKRTIASWYNKGLRGIKGLTLPVEMPWAKNVYWQYGILVNDEFGMDRNQVMEELRKRGIDTRAFFVPMHKQKILHNIGLFRGESHPVSEYISEHGLYLPSGNTLTKSKVLRVCSAIKELSKR